MSTVSLTTNSQKLCELFALAYQKMLWKEHLLQVPLHHCDKLFAQAAVFLLETDMTLPRGKVPAIKELRKMAQKPQRVGIQCLNKAFVACFPDANISHGDDEVIELLLPASSLLGLKEAKDIIDSFLNALTITQDS